MLKITLQAESDEVRLKLAGDLAGTWVTDFEECWRSTRASSAGKPVCLDLTGVTRVDDAGRYLLALIFGTGARMVSTGVEMKDLLDSIGRDWPAKRLDPPSRASMEKPMKNRFRALPTLSLLAAAALAVACGKPQARPPQGPAEVGTVTVIAEKVVLTTELPGRTSPYLVAEVRPQVNGLIRERTFEEGSDVKAGALLYQIDPAPYQAAYDQAKASLAMAEANVPAARSRAERLRGLVEIRAAGQQDYDDAAAAALQAEASVAAAKAAVESARVNLSYTPIRAPIPGRTGRSSVTVGALVTAYQPVPLATVQQLDPIYVDVVQSSAELLRLRQGFRTGGLTRNDSSWSKVKLVLEDGTTYGREGKLKFQDVTVDPTTGSVSVRMVFPNPDHVLLPGMFVRAILEEGVRTDAILVPQQGVSRDQKGAPFCFVVGADGKAEQRTLTLDRAIGDRWVVTKGLAAGDRVIVEGLQRVRPGADVKPVPFGAAAK